MNVLTKRFLLFILSVLLVFPMLAGCDFLSQSDKVIKVKEVTCDGKLLTVLYKDGYELSYPINDLLEYTVSTSAFDDSNNGTEAATGFDGSNTSDGNENELPTKSDDQTERIPLTPSDIFGSSNGQVFINGGGNYLPDMSLLKIGVRAVGTDNNTLPDKGEEIIAVTSPNITTNIELDAYLMHDNKKYESFDAYAKDYIVSYMTEVTVQESFGEESVCVVLEGGFSCLPHLKKITLPATITKIEYAAFYRCSALTEIVFEGTAEQWNAIQKADGWDLESGNYTVRCTDGNIEKAS